MPSSILTEYSEEKLLHALAVCENLVAFMADKSGPKDRVTVLVAEHGECVTQAKAARILDRHPSSIAMMLKDGRLTRAGDNRVDVRSIAAYLDNPKQNDFKARIARQNGGKAPRFHAV